MKNKLEHALALISEGFYIFPLAANSKVPPKGMKWTEQSSKSQKDAEKWWAKNPNYNIGIDAGASGLNILDVDTKEGKKGMEWYEARDAMYDFPKTFSVKTTSGGFHHYFKTSVPFQNTTGRLYNGIDTRSRGGYVVGPGSVVDGKEYIIVADNLPADMPEWFASEMQNFKILHQSANKTKVYSSDNEADIERGKHWLINVAEKAVEGNGGDKVTYATAARLREMGLSAITAFELMADHWNDECLPPWDYAELQVKVDNAYKYANKAQGSDAIGGEFTVVEMPKAEQKIYFPFCERFQISDIPPRDWVFGHAALKKNVSLLVAPAGMGKSTFAIQMAISKAAGRDLVGMDIRGKGAVAIHNNEDDLMEMQRRMAAIMQRNNITHDDFMLNGQRTLLLGAGDKLKFKAAKRNPMGLLKPVDSELIIERLIEAHVQMLIIDPFAETHPANENDNGEMLDVMEIYRDIAQRANCAVILVHHDRKPDGASAEGHIGNMYSARGASSILGAVRILMTYHTMPPKDGKKYGIPEEYRFLYNRLDFGKANMSRSHGEPLWYKKDEEIIGRIADDPDSGEAVGVIDKIELAAPSIEGTHLFDLICDVEAILLDRGAELPIAEISQFMISEMPAHEGKNPAALTKAIRRIFLEAESVPSNSGDLYFTEKQNAKGKQAHWIKLVVTC